MASWKDIDDLAGGVAAQFPAMVWRIEATPYEDQFGRAAVKFTVWLRDKNDDADYSWSELSPIETRLSDELLKVDAERMPYTDYVLESEAAERKAAMGG